MSGMSAILSTMGKFIPPPVLSLLGGGIVDGGPGANAAAFHWNGDGTTGRSTRGGSQIQLNPATDWITPRSGPGIDLSEYEVQVTVSGSAVGGSPVNTYLSAEINYNWELTTTEIIDQSILTVTVREKLDPGNNESNTYTLLIDSS